MLSVGAFAALGLQTLDSRTVAVCDELGADHYVLPVFLRHREGGPEDQTTNV
jgi:hypothetical protein